MFCCEFDEEIYMFLVLILWGQICICAIPIAFCISVMDVLLMKMMGMEEVFDDIISVVRECCIMSTNQICIASAQIQM